MTRMRVKMILAMAAVALLAAVGLFLGLYFGSAANNSVTASAAIVQSCRCSRPAYNTVRVGATCTAAGYEYSLCGLCQKEIAGTRVIIQSALGHDPVGVATCTTDQTCSRCDEVLQAGGHTPGPAATCTTDQICTVCGEVLQKASHGHTVLEVSVKPTCTGKGYVRELCLDCHQYVTTEIEAAGHTPGPAATCTEVQTCRVCGVVLEASRGGHTFTSFADCFDRVCTVCNETVPASADHTPLAPSCYATTFCMMCGTDLGVMHTGNVVQNNRPATCTGKGHVTLICLDCDGVISSYDIPATGHHPGQEATCTKPQTCVDCGATFVAALGHDLPLDAACIDQACTRCGETIAATMYHDWADWHLVTAPTDTMAGEKVRVCTACGTEERAAVGDQTTGGAESSNLGKYFDTFIHETLPGLPDTTKIILGAVGGVVLLGGIIWLCCALFGKRRRRRTRR